MGLKWHQVSISKQNLSKLWKNANKTFYCVENQPWRNSIWRRRVSETFSACSQRIIVGLFVHDSKCSMKKMDGYCTWIMCKECVNMLRQAAGWASGVFGSWITAVHLIQQTEKLVARMCKRILSIVHASCVRYGAPKGTWRWKKWDGKIFFYACAFFLFQRNAYVLEENVKVL